MSNTKIVLHCPLVDFGEGHMLVIVVTGGKQSQRLVLGLRLELDYT